MSSDPQALPVPTFADVLAARGRILRGDRVAVICSGGNASLDQLRDLLVR